MRRTRRLTILLACCCAAFGTFGTSGCTVLDSAMYYQFSFDMTADGQHAVVLEYKLSAGDQLVMASIPSAKTNGLYAEGVYTSKLRPTRLSVHWKDLADGRDYVQDADLTGKLKGDLNGTTIYLMIDGAHLSIFLVLPSQRGAEQPSIGPRIYSDRAVSLVYSN